VLYVCIVCLCGCVCVFTEAGASNSPAPSGDKNALRRVIDFVRETSDENLRDVNRKLQRVLEETLTKNIHLQKVNFQLSKPAFYFFLVTDS